MKKISIIVPVYKVESYLSRCIDSILAQTYQNFELILVDDGSPDRCGEICDNYAKKDDRIKEIHQPNGGLSAARNAGLDLAIGDYIGFVDSDDYISINMYNDMIKLLEVNGLDIIICTAFMVKGDKVKGFIGDGRLTIYDKKEILNKSLSDFENTAWNKVYTRAAIGDVRFPEGRLFEDTATSYLIFNNCTKVGRINKAYYYYYRNHNSITQTSFKTKARMDFVLGYIERLNFAIENGLDCIPQCKSLLMKAALSCLTAVYVSDKNEFNLKTYNEIRGIILKYRDADAYCELNFKYKVFLWCFDRCDIVHKISAHISRISKLIKHKLN